MRQLADLVGISNPYLSQIERGLREPSERVVGGDRRQPRDVGRDAQAASAAPAAGETRREESAVVAAIRADPDLSAKERAALIEVYEAFVATKATEPRRPCGAPRLRDRRGGRRGAATV